MLTEQLLHFIWQSGYYNKSSLTTPDGVLVEVLHPGTYNRNSGPDFLQARIRIGDTLLAGAVEMHLRTSDWRQHKHSGDAAYNNVVLHVVWQHDGFEMPHLPVLELQSRVASTMLQHYQLLMRNEDFIPCAPLVHTVPPLVWVSWKERLLTERLAQKTSHLQQQLLITKNDWEQVCWQMVARYAGGTVNKEAFEEVAQAVPAKLLWKHRLQPLQLEALLLGAAGLLEADVPASEYEKNLQQEFQFLKSKYNLRNVSVAVKFLRMRPSGFPTVRLAQLAQLFAAQKSPFGAALEAKTVDELRTQFNLTASRFWDTHYTFSKTAASVKKTLGADAVDRIIINALVPLVFYYGAATGDDAQKEKALHWLQSIAAEQNSIIAGFQKLGVPAMHAFDTQALLQLKPAYCDVRRCLDCAVGYRLMKTSQAQSPQ